ncbi:hypothetical protein GCM10010497_52460 [Streptomyces cinereoruber]|uniref:N-acetyltransferase n=1 Tax=Streptomyces cinereoruber TaxID=67260 RepID=A0AAV4KRW2_9ACTN|nr:N-acetyltransferase [Streptomyces sp. WAC00288]KYG53662.1 hypothetical protein AWI43_03560 [Streptomyces sp. WAC04657]GGR42653.1 hypothetical protein GCM10010497_52460 [Streptomyces cinereoruber]
MRVAERVGFRREGVREGWLRVGGERRDVLVFALPHRDGRTAARPGGATSRTSRAPGHDRTTGMH